MTPRCPTAVRLREYELGQVEADAQAAIASHLEHCQDCRRRLSAMAIDGDCVVEALHLPPVEWPFLRDGAYLQGLQAVRQMMLAAVEHSSPAVPPRSTRFGQYLLLETLGKGGMGIVYKALHEPLAKVVALKIMSPRHLADPAAVARFRREARSVARLEHPNIVRAMDAGEVDGRLYLVMDFIEGVDLGTLVRRSGALPIAAACEIARQAATGLQHALEQGLVHRDIKPSNLMLASTGDVKILDLGLSRVSEERSSDLTSSRGFLGTADYISPEQIDDASKADIRSDLYSLGCTLYHLLAGHPPFRQAAVHEKLLAHQRQKPRSLREIHRELPDKLVALIDRTLSKDPAERPPTPNALAQAVAPYCEGANLLQLLGPDWRGRSTVSLPAAAMVTHTDQPLPPVGTQETDAAPKKPFRRARVVAAAVCLLAWGTWMGQSLFVPAQPAAQAIDSKQTHAEAEPMALVATLRGHSQEIHAVAFAGDEHRVLSSSGDQSIRLWRVSDSSQEQLFVWKGRITRDQTLVRSLAASPSGQLLVAGDNKGRVQQWDLRNLGRPGGVDLQHVGRSGAIRCVAISPNGGRIASADDRGNVCVWQTATGHKEQEFAQGTTVYDVAISPDNQSILIGDKRGGLVLKALADGSSLEFRGHEHQICNVGFTADGLEALSAGGRIDNKGTADNTIRVWNLKTRQNVRTLHIERHPSHLYDVAFSPDGSRALSAHRDGSIRLWDLRTARAIASLPQAHGGAVTCVAFSPQGQLALSGGKDNLVKVWRLPDEQSDDKSSQQDP